MIVMKFGGTSVESAAAIERVASIVRARAERRPVVVVSAMGKTTNKLLAIANAAIAGHRADYIAQIHDLRDFHSREARLVVPLAERAELDRTLDEHFQELTELVKGLAVLGELTPRSIDAISSYGERLSSYIVSLAFAHFGMKTAHVDARRVIVTDHRHTQAAPLYPETYARLARRDSAAREGQDRRDGRLHRRDRGRRHHHAGPRRLGFHGIHRGRGHRRRRNPDLDRCGRHADRRSHDSSRRPSRQDHLLRRSRGAGLLRREGAASGDRDSGGREEYSGADSEFAPAGSGRHAHRGGIGACTNAVKSIACKRKITLVNIHSTRMLMAHGFLKRIFDVFERLETPVDMVATSEVSVSLTIDNPQRLAGNLRRAAPVFRSLDRGRPGHRMPGGRQYPLHAGRCGARVSRRSNR